MLSASEESLLGTAEILHSAAPVLSPAEGLHFRMRFYPAYESFLLRRLLEAMSAIPATAKAAPAGTEASDSKNRKIKAAAIRKRTPPTS
jgi:hypothetical protein